MSATQYTSHPPPLSPFENAFLTLSPFSSELLSMLTTAAKFNLFACSSSLALYRDACYTWQDVCLTKDGYQPLTSLAKVNYQIDARIRGPQKCSQEIQKRNSSTPRKASESQIDRFFCPTFRTDAVWALINSRPGIGCVLKSLTLDGTGINMKLVQDVLQKCMDEGRGLKYLSIRYCDRVRFDEVLNLLPAPPSEEDEDDSDSGFESASDSEDDDNIFRTLKVFRLYGIRDLTLHGQQLRQWQAKIERFRKYAAGRHLETDVAWCSPSPYGNDKNLRREGCKGTREVPFQRVSPIADSGSLRKLNCSDCEKSPKELGYFCDGCLKDLLCEDCGSFVCNECDPTRDRLVSCTDCSVRRCHDCFESQGGSFCPPTEEHSAPRPSCGEHNRELQCNDCDDLKAVSCSACYPSKKCRVCNEEMYNHCDNKDVFKCDCDYELCSKCFIGSRDAFLSKGHKMNSLEELVTGLGGDKEEFPPIVPRVLSVTASKNLIQTPAGWSCVWCRLLPRRRERMLEQRVMGMRMARMLDRQ